MNDTLVMGKNIQLNAQMIPREQLQLVTRQKLASNYFQFHHRLGRRWGLLCRENIHCSSWCNPVPENSVGDVCLLTDNVSIIFPVWYIILLICTCLNSYFLAFGEIYLRNSAVELRNITYVYSSILKSPSHRISWAWKCLWENWIWRQN